MDLEKTLNNLKKSKTGFFNMDNFFVNFDTFKLNLLYRYKIYGREYFNIISQNVNLEYGGESCYRFTQELVHERHVLYIFKNKFFKETMTLSYQLFIGEYELAKNNN